MSDFIKKMAELFTQLNEAEGMGALVEINEIELAYKNHVSELKKLHIADVVKSLPTDRAIDQAAFESSYGYSDDNYNSFKEGVKWVIEQLKTFNTKEK